MTSLTGAMLIGASEHFGSDGQVHAVNPRTGQQLAPAYGLGGAAEVDRAAQLAWEAFPVCRQTSPPSRAAFLDTIAANIEALGSVLVERVCDETGLPESRVLQELARTCKQLRLFGSVVRDGGWLGARVDLTSGIRQQRIPLGPVAVFCASNFPLAFSVAGGDTASALAAGAPVVVKAHSAHPGVSELVGRAIRSAVQEHDFAPGTFSMLFGSGPGLGIDLVRHPRIKAVGFTGSRLGGLALLAAAAARPEPIPVYAEMSSVNPVIVLPEALERDGAALGRALIASVTTGMGQLCTSPGLVFLPDGPGGEDFLRAAAEAAASTPSAPMLSEAICSAFHDGIDRWQTTANVTTLARGAEEPAIAYAGRAGLFLTDTATFMQNARLHEEVFGAATLVVRVGDLAELPAILERLGGQLTVSVHAHPGDYPRVRELLACLELVAGRIVFNGWPTGVEVGHAVVHGGPYPATSDSRTTSVGSLAIDRFLRPVSYQNAPHPLVPQALSDDNPLGLWRLVDGKPGWS